MRLASLSLLLVLGGCVPYPIYKTLQPAADVTVHDRASKPLQGARVAIISNAYPYGWEKSRELKETDANGIAKFDRRKEWRTEVIMIHGAEIYFWNWCVEKSGFVTHVSANRSADTFSSASTIVLSEGPSTPCPVPYR